MAQYQSFPGAVGDSKSLDKLKALRLPMMAGRSFLDIGCNEGFFCGFALFQGASRVVGIDHSAEYVQRASVRFPSAEFLLRSWDELPEGKFDVILLASALHYADDQPGLIRRLVDKLTDTGTLILELGVIHSAEACWNDVQRGIDVRSFPSMPMLREVLRDYAWKWMGPSIRQDGDPVSRQVVHVCRRRPLAYLMMQPPGYGKTSVAASLFGRAGVTVVSGDGVVAEIGKGGGRASPALADVIRQGFSPYEIDRAIQRVFDAGMGAELVRYWLSQAEGRDLALDVYVPQDRHGAVRTLAIENGYLPVQMDWDRIAQAPLNGDEIARQAEAYYLAMLEPTGDQGATNWENPGILDEAWVEGGVLLLRGWTVGRDARVPERVEVELGREVLGVTGMERELRPDVQQSLGLPHGLVGFRLALALPSSPPNAGDLVRRLKLRFAGRQVDVSHVRMRS